MYTPRSDAVARSDTTALARSKCSAAAGTLDATENYKGCEVVLQGEPYVGAYVDDEAKDVHGTSADIV